MRPTTATTLLFSSLLLAALLLAAPRQATAGRKNNDWSYFPEEAPTAHDRIDPGTNPLPKPFALRDPSDPGTNPLPKPFALRDPSDPTSTPSSDPSSNPTSSSSATADYPTSHTRTRQRATISNLFLNPILTRRAKRPHHPRPITTVFHRSKAPATPPPTPTTATTPTPATPPRPTLSHDPSREWSYFEEDAPESKRYSYIDDRQAETFRPRDPTATTDPSSRRSLRQVPPPEPKLPLYYTGIDLDRNRPFPPPEKASTALNTNSSYFGKDDGRLPMEFRGGRTMDLAYVHLIFVGDTWDPAAVKLLTSPINASIHFMLNVDKSRWWNTARYYGNNGDTTWSNVPGRVQLRQAKILPIPDTSIQSEPNLIDYMEYYLKTKRLDFYVNSSIYFFVLPDTRPNLVSSPGNDESCTKWCGIHSYIGARFLDETTNAEVVYNITYGAVVHPLSCGDKLWQCAARGLWGSNPTTGLPVAPNSFVADAIVNVMGHELAETVIDPYKDAWFDADRAEPADKCNYNFGNFTTEPVWWNNRIARRPFLLQALWHPVAQTCAVNSTSNPQILTEAPVIPPTPPAVV